ncbi:hypothetical protein KP509_09G046100 [Ceratopteris richardii]|uniref:Cyclin n=1 Tax=Ceratopteris richardii TaxID=49495 RepID=A0A8T2U286_CERRI|nr:hypothetical protein KP509_09G046100 [Ceratopteris richardii]
MDTRRRTIFNAPSLVKWVKRRAELKKELLAGNLQPQLQKKTRANNADASAASKKSEAPAVPPPPSSSEKVIPNILPVMSSILTRIVSRNEQNSSVVVTLKHNNSKSLSSFQGLRAPGISLSKYLERIHKYTNVSLSCFVVAYIYMDRLIHRHPDEPITSMNVHRLLITSVMTAAKVVEDVHFNNAFYAKVGGVTITELNKLELKLLFCLDFRLQVTPRVFEDYCSHLERELHIIGYTNLHPSIRVFGDIEELASVEQLVKEGLELKECS